MSNDNVAILAVDVTEEESDNVGESNLATRLQANGGRIIEVLDGITTAEFDSALAAVDCAVQIQRTRSASSPALRAVRVAVDFYSGDRTGGNSRPEEIEQLLSILNLAEAGGICMARTVHDVVRPGLELPYDSQVVLKDWYYACAPLRQNKKNICLMTDSVVRLSAASLALRECPAATREAGLLLRAFRALF